MSNLKTEILENDKYSLSITDWNASIEHSLQLMQTNEAKIRCNASPLCYWCEINEDSFMKKDHLSPLK